MDSAIIQYFPRVYGMYLGCPPGLGCTRRQGIVMELMERGSLLSLQRALSKPPPWPLAFRLAHQVALAMNFLHSKKIPLVHMDLKPGNVLLDANLNAKVSNTSTFCIQIIVEHCVCSTNNAMTTYNLITNLGQIVYCHIFALTGSL